MNIKLDNTFIVLQNPTKVNTIFQNPYYKLYREMRLEERKQINFECPNAFDIELVHEYLMQLKKSDIIQKGVIEQYKRDMKPMHDKIVKPLKEYADIILTVI